MMAARTVGMTQPRYVVPGATVMVTRRALRRTYLFRPDEELTAAYLYCLAVTKGSLDPNNPRWPKQATLQLTLPAALSDRTADEVRDIVSAEMARRVDEAVEDMRKKGRSFMGRRGVRKASPYERATSWEPLRSTNPTFAVGQDKEARAAAVAALRAFRNAYRAALERWRAGDRDVDFPAGTWRMRVLHAANVAPA